MRGWPGSASPTRPQAVPDERPRHLRVGIPDARSTRARSGRVHYFAGSQHVLRSDRNACAVLGGRAPFFLSTPVENSPFRRLKNPHPRMVPKADQREARELSWRSSEAPFLS